ncbi:MAG TPA: S-methyl-5'-thioadenosine phosphorylase [Candidatus Acidoferrum sp.]|nr:S-methyl-5'-thioadenosine phosphorylase [Candidatus Acidoferrum sp.]
MKAEIGVIGGSGIYSLLNDARDVSMSTKYGATSEKVSIGTLQGRETAFIPRHGKKHTTPPHKVPYRANIQALKDLGVRRVIGTGAIGSLREDYKPGDFVIFDQFVNMTHGRDDTFFDEDRVIHVSTAEPYCPELRSLALKTAKKMGISVHGTGTILVINGPRFSSKAESRFFSANKMDVISMTQYPEVALAREKGMCYLGVGIVTDYDSGLEGNSNIKPVSFDEITRMFSKNVETLKVMISNLVEAIPEKQKCDCAKSLEGAEASH